MKFSDGDPGKKMGFQIMPETGGMVFGQTEILVHVEGGNTLPVDGARSSGTECIEEFVLRRRTGENDAGPGLVFEHRFQDFGDVLSGGEAGF